LGIIDLGEEFVATDAWDGGMHRLAGNWLLRQ
jgi:hypothetical protein